MRRNVLKPLCCLILTAVIAFTASASAFAASTNSPKILVELQNINGFKYVNNAESPKSDKLLTKSKFNLLKSSALPSKYNLADNNYVTGVKNQYPYGTCWAFSTLASLESNLVKSGNADASVDLSEKHLIWFNYNGVDNSGDESLFAGKDTYNSLGYSPFLLGGSMYMASSTLMRRYGASDESRVPYNFSNGTDVDKSLKNISDIYLKNAAFLPQTTSIILDDSGNVTSQSLLDSETVSSNINEIKQSIYTKGAVAASYYCSDSMRGNKTDDNYWNNTYKCYYFDAKLLGEDYFQQANHGITLVGWDDSFSKNNFAITPPNDGAWIVKNSWGSNWGNDGYFYLSYYDLSFSEPVSYEAENAEYKADGTTKHEYKNIYQYDGIGFGDAQIYYGGKNSCKSANFFTSRGNEQLEAISISSLYDNVTINYEIYTDVTSDINPTLGRLAAKGSKAFANKGYYTIPLDNYINLSSGEKYSVVINMSFTSGKSDYSILACETQISDYTSINVSDNQSSYCVYGTWEKIDSGTNILGCKIGNATVKAYTNDITPILYGDVNEDGVLNIQDATEIQKYCADLITFSESQKEIADINRSGNVDISDATKVQYTILGL